MYAEDATAGGVSQRGSFTLSDESTDVVVLPVLSSSAAGPPGPLCPATAPTIAYTPTTSGPHTLQVQAVDRAGNVSPARLYRFTVAAAVVTGGGGSGCSTRAPAPSPPAPERR